MTRFVSPAGVDRRARGFRRVSPARMVAVGVILLAGLIGVGVATGSGQGPKAAPTPQIPLSPVPAPQPSTALPPGSAPLGVPVPANGLPGVQPGTPKTPAVNPGAQPMPPVTVGPQPIPGGQPPGVQPNPFGGPLSNPLISPAPPGLTASPKTTPATQEKVAKYVSKLIDPETTLDLVVGQTRVLVLKNQPFRIQAGDDRVLAVNVITPRELLLQGKAVGATVLNIWFGDPTDPAKQETLTYLVRVFPDPEAKERLERAFKALEDDIQRNFPDSRVKLKIVGDKLVVTGRVRDYVQGGQILRIIRANMPGGDVGALPVVPAGGQAPAGGPPADPTGATNPPTPDSFFSAGGPNVINLLEVAGEQQVALRVVVAEVNRAAARSVGMNFSVTNRQGITVFANLTGPVINPLQAAGLGVAGLNGLNGGGGFGGFGGVVANIPFNVDAGRLPFALHALKNLQYARSLAEPTLVTMNGQTANFLAGGQFPVPIIGGFGVGGLQGVSYVPYGVQLNFTPFLTDRDRVRLVLNANVSTRDLNSGTNIGGGQVAGLNTRNVNTTVELRQGETLAIAGLIEYNIGADSTRIPFIGDIPGLNNLTGLQRVEVGEKELVIFITPELVRPLDPHQAIPLPGYEILDPNDVEFYLWGRIEGHCKDYRSPIRTDLSRIRQYQMTEAVNIAGPSGYSPIP